MPDLWQVVCSSAVQFVASSTYEEFGWFLRLLPNKYALPFSDLMLAVLRPTMWRMWMRMDLALMRKF